MTTHDEVSRTADDDLADAAQYLARARSATTGAEVLALVGIGHAVIAEVRQRREFYREVVDVLTAARPGTPEA
ncbi:hypothetical protein BBK82_03235 [Lentzea guizhouensis]|uniref:Uncharacterized protein n=1 Tax=Lentzea guizhouensis TaxID=1586287 RepID=A0A1B2HBX5_9PSEU|nr:hypothetical protein [Lentzea guizhouensis]ANZ35231.1 hypothetical protein BBK82_03235 [Lentzea guizhouensis]